MRALLAVCVVVLFAPVVLAACSGPGSSDPPASPGTVPESTASSDNVRHTVVLSTAANPNDGTGQPDATVADAAIPTIATPTSSPEIVQNQETSTPLPALSPGYADPEVGIIRALTELGYPTTAANPMVGLYLQIAPRLQRLYNLATAPVGYFNADTEGFVEWLKVIISNPDSAVMDLMDHAYAQIRVAIYEPESDIGRRIRLIEAGEDPLFPRQGPWVCDSDEPFACTVVEDHSSATSKGAWVYWEYMISPTALPWNMNRMSIAGIKIEFEQLVMDYGAALVANPFAYPDFGSYLASVNYDRGGRLAVD